MQPWLIPSASPILDLSFTSASLVSSPHESLTLLTLAACLSEPHALSRILPNQPDPFLTPLMLSCGAAGPAAHLMRCHPILDQPITCQAHAFSASLLLASCPRDAAECLSNTAVPDG